MFGFRKNRSSQEGLSANAGYVLETGWYLPGNPDPWSERTPEDKAESESLLPSEEFFAVVGMAMGQLPMPDGIYRNMDTPPQPEFPESSNI